MMKNNTITANCYKQKNYKKVNVFKNINSELVVTKIVAINIRGGENMDHFILDQPAKISENLKKWTFEPIDSIGRCGYDYTLFFYDNNNTLIDYSDLCFQCNRLAFQHEIYKISEKEIVQLLKNDFTPVYKQMKTFKSIQEGRAFWKKMEEESNIFYLKKDQPLWLKYDGKFEVNFSTNNSSREAAESFLQSRFQEVSNKQEYKFRLASKKESEGTFSYRYYVYSSKEIYDKLEGIIKKNWKELSISEVELFYKNKPE